MLTTLDEVVSRVVERVRPDKVFLFGSRARGEDGPDSDIDLLVVADLPGDRMERTAAVNMALFPRLVSIDLLVYTPGEFAMLASEPGSFVQEIIRTGRLEYDAKDRGVA